MKKDFTMDDYIRETPEVFLSNLRHRKSLTEKIVNAYEKGGYKNILIIASGSSNNSAVCAVPFMERILKIPVRVMTPSYFCDYGADIPADTMSLVISQSGYSTNAIQAARRIQDTGRNAIVLTGDTGSDIAGSSDLLIDYGMGTETVGYTTKGALILIEFLMLFALEASRTEDRCSAAEYERIIVLLEKAAQAHKLVYDASQKLYEENKEQLNHLGKVYILGSGANVGTALEGALKLSETVHCVCCAYETEEYIHGPNIQVKEDYTLFFFDSFTCVKDRISQIREASRCLTPNIYALSGEFIKRQLKIAEEDREWFELISPLFNIVYFQYLSYKITEETDGWEDNGEAYDRFDALVHSKTETYEKMYQEGLVT